MADKDDLQLDAFADERVAETLTRRPTLAPRWISTNAPIGRFVANLAAVEGDELEDRDVLAEPDVGNRLKLHKAIRRPFAQRPLGRLEERDDPAARAASVSGARCCAIDSENSCATSESASRRSNFGAYMSPVR